jgi:uncharacterized protein YcfJ
MQMFKNTLLVAIGATLMSTAAFAEQVRVPIINKTPIYASSSEYVGSKRECTTYQTQQQQPGVFNGTGEALKGNGDALFGAILGGVIGNQFGGGTGKDVMTGLGVIVGSNVGAGTNKKPQPTTTTVCNDVPQYSEVNRVVGYRVKYRFDGGVYTTKMDKDPGSYITLNIHQSHSVGKN